MNIEQDKHEKTPVDIAAVSAVDRLIRRLKPLGGDCAEVFVRARLYRRPLVGIAMTMRLSITDVQACLDQADLHSLMLLEEDRERIFQRVPIPADIYTPKADLKVQEDVYRDALRRVGRLDSLEDITAYWSQFEPWLRQSSQHEEAHRRVEQARTQAALFGHALRAVGVQEDALVAEVSRRLQPSRWRAASRTWLPLTATAVLMLTGLVVFRNYTMESSWSFYTTTLEQRTFALSDGTVLQLDAGTDVRVRVTPLHRQIVLERGQILCEVRHEWLRTFDVLINRNTVRAVGTKFVVSRKSDHEFETLVTQGAVQVLAIPGTQNIEGDYVVVRAGELVMIGAELLRIDRLNPADIDLRLAWAHGQIALDGTLEQAVKTFNRYNRRQLIIDDPNIRGVPVTGLYDAHSPDLFADDLLTSHHIGHDRPGLLDPKEGDIHLRSTP
jgi:ferric-dicitrate binding protein FerR (iron transport regulator)